MKKMVLFLFFAVTLVATFMYYDDPRYYRRQFQRQMRKCRRQMDCWQDSIHDMMKKKKKTLSWWESFSSF